MRGGAASSGLVHMRGRRLVSPPRSLPLPESPPSLNSRCSSLPFPVRARSANNKAHATQSYSPSCRTEPCDTRPRHPTPSRYGHSHHSALPLPAMHLFVSPAWLPTLPPSTLSLGPCCPPILVPSDLRPIACALLDFSPPIPPPTLAPSENRQALPPPQQPRVPARACARPSSPLRPPPLPRSRLLIRSPATALAPPSNRSQKIKPQPTPPSLWPAPPPPLYAPPPHPSPPRLSPYVPSAC